MPQKAVLTAVFYRRDHNFLRSISGLVEYCNAVSFVIFFFFIKFVTCK